MYRNAWCIRLLRWCFMTEDRNYLNFYCIFFLWVLGLCRHRLVRHTALITVYQSLSVRTICNRFIDSAEYDTNGVESSRNSVVVSLEVENVNTVLVFFNIDLNWQLYEKLKKNCLVLFQRHSKQFFLMKTCKL